MKISYYLNSERKKNLYCRITDGKERVTFSLAHYVDPENWDKRNESIKWDKQYSGALWSLKKVLGDKFELMTDNDSTEKLEILKEKALSYIEDDGLEGLQRKLWDARASELNMNSYDEFITAIEKYSGHKRNQLTIISNEYSMIYMAPDGVQYEVDTYSGHFNYLKDLVKTKNYEEIFTQTWSELWEDIFSSYRIKKSKFLPQLLFNWEQLWADNKSTITSQSRYHSLKEESWNRFMVFMSCYDDSDPFQLAQDLSDIELRPIFIVTMLNLRDLDDCIDEYCDYYFSNRIWNWDSLDLEGGDNSNESSETIFYFREEEA